MQKKLLNKIIKANLNEKKSLSDLIDEFILTQTNHTKEQLEEYLSSLFVYVNKNFDKIPKNELINILHSKLQDLNIQFDTKDIDEIYASIATATSVGTTTVVFDKIDTKAIDFMRKGFVWASDKYNTDTQELLKDTIEQAFKGEISRAGLGAVLKESFQGIIDKDENYFKLVADTVISQSQNISRLNQALKYDVQYFRVRARIDLNTSDFCRSINGKIISAVHLKKQMNKILDSTNIDEKKEAAPWQNKAIFGELPPNIGLPPYHGRCRTEIVPAWLKVEEIDGKKVRYASKKKDDIIAHIDKTGVQRRINDLTYNHSDSSSARYVSKKDTIAALNSIKEIAPHKKYSDRSVALSNNGYFMVFKSDYLYTIMKEPRKNYFKDNAILDKKEVIKWKNITYVSQTDGQSKIKQMLIKILNWTK
ncbi:MAG: hypothetical protein AB7D96_10640 [Arcobacteraceae bacterium]